MKLWEKSAIAKIAVKRGVENTRNERMAEELKVRHLIIYWWSNFLVLRKLLKCDFGIQLLK